MGVGVPQVPVIMSFCKLKCAFFHLRFVLRMRYVVDFSCIISDEIVLYL